MTLWNVLARAPKLAERWTLGSPPSSSAPATCCSGGGSVGSPSAISTIAPAIRPAP